MGLQPQRLGESRVFVLPNTSGRNAHYSFDQMLAAFESLRQDVEAIEAPARDAPPGRRQLTQALTRAKEVRLWNSGLWSARRREWRHRRPLP